MSIHEHAAQGLLSPVTEYNQRSPPASPRPVSPVSFVSTSTRVNKSSGNSSTSSLPRPKRSLANSLARPKQFFEKPNPGAANSLRQAKGTSQWWPEILSAAGAIVFFAILIAILIYLDNTAQNRWQMPWQIKPSAIISVLITLCQMALTPILTEGISQLKWVYFEQRPQRLTDFETFDEASRGPWGALALMYKVNWKASVASVGAVLVVLALGMGPFTQQVLYTTDITTSMTGAAANLGASKFYNSGSVQASVDTSHQDTAPNRLDGGSSSATSSIPAPTSTEGGYAFLTPGQLSSLGSDFSSTSSSAAATASPSGIFPPGYHPPRKREIVDSSQNTPCAETRMIRAAFEGLYSSNTQAPFECQGGNCTWSPFTSLGVCSQCTDVSQAAKESCNGTSSTGQSCTYHLAESDITFSAKSTCSDGSFSGTAWQSFVEVPTEQTSSELVTFDALMLPLDYVYPNNCSMPAPVIRSCSLSWCAQTFGDSSTTNGKLQDEPTSFKSLVPFHPTNTTCAGLRNLLPPPTSSTGITWQAFINAENACPQSSEDVGANDIFWVNANDHVMTGSMFKLIFDDQTLAPGDTSNILSMSQMATLQALVENNNGDLPATVDGIATGMTNYLRSVNGAYYIQGLATSTTTVYKVSWPWLIYPALLVGLGVVFLIVTIWFSREKSRVVWKSSSLAVLAHGLGDGRELDERSLGGMREKAEGVRVQLMENEEGDLKLVRQ